MSTLKIESTIFILILLSKLIFSNYIGPYVELAEQRKDVVLSHNSVRMNDGAILTVFDSENSLKCRILICHSDSLGEDRTFQIEGEKPTFYEEKLEEEEPEEEDSQENDAEEIGTKRQRDVVDLTDSEPIKKAKIDVDIID
jgi:hypothetical protein